MRKNPKPLGIPKTPAEKRAYKALMRAKTEREMGLLKPVTGNRYGLAQKPMK